MIIRLFYILILFFAGKEGGHYTEIQRAPDKIRTVEGADEHA